MSSVQAHQKDGQIETILSGKLVEVVKNFKGQLFTNTHPFEISVAVKLIYLCLTTLKGSRTLGEEYVDLIYVNRKGTKLVERYKKLMFILSYCLVPYLASKAFQRWKPDDSSNSKVRKYSFKGVLNSMINLHLVWFYFKGAYYDVYKRVFGLRYALGHEVEANEAKFRKSSSESYKLLGYVLLLQGASKWLPVIVRQLNLLTSKFGVSDLYRDRDLPDGGKDIITGIPSEPQTEHINLSDSLQLSFIPQASRTCILCLNTMTDPSCALCGHVFCWDCILNWCRERPECPLCRQQCKEQQILPLR